MSRLRRNHEEGLRFRKWKDQLLVDEAAEWQPVYEMQDKLKEQQRVLAAFDDDARESNNYNRAEIARQKVQVENTAQELEKVKAKALMQADRLLQARSHEKQEEREARETAASIVIQRFWRAFSCRRTYKRKLQAMHKQEPRRGIQRALRPAEKRLAEVEAAQEALRMELQSVAQTVRALGRQSAHVLGRMQFLLDEVEGSGVDLGARTKADSSVSARTLALSR